jgi:pimeloyl-ACP methyl ester carboxylesterase
MPERLRANQFETLRTSDIPVRVIIGDHDLVDFGLAGWPSVAEVLERVEMTTLENAGHNAWIDRPEAFRDALRRALHLSGE